MNTGESWRVVPSVPGVQASSLGRVRSSMYSVGMPNGGSRMRRLAPTMGVAVRKHGVVIRMLVRFRGTTHKVHRLVCEAFHGTSPEGFPLVMHVDESGSNNVPANLAWGTAKQNLNAPGFVAYCKSRTGENSQVTKGRMK